MSIQKPNSYLMQLPHHIFSPHCASLYSSISLSNLLITFCILCLSSSSCPCFQETWLWPRHFRLVWKAMRLLQLSIVLYVFCVFFSSSSYSIRFFFISFFSFLFLLLYIMCACVCLSLDIILFYLLVFFCFYYLKNLLTPSK